MAKILFLNPPHKFKFSRPSRWSEYTKSGTLYYPIWLSYACGYALNEKHDALLIDAIAECLSFNETINKVLEFNPDLLVVDTSTPSIYNDIKFVQELKKRKNIKSVLVGTHSSVFPKEILKKFKQIDFIAVGEYDETISDLANNLDKPQKLKGIAYRKNKKIILNKLRSPIENLDNLPFVSEIYKRFLDVKDYRYALARHPMIQIMTSRGCPNFCTFCCWPQTFMGRKYRARSPENVVDELEYIKKELPMIKEVFIEDDTFSIYRKRVLEICRLIKAKKLKIIWSVNVRADLDYDLLKSMKESGCRLLVVGYESGNQEILNNIKKGITLKQAEEFTENAKKLGFKIFGCFMIGLPGDNKETIQQTFNFAKKLNPDMAFFQQAVPFPGTEFYKWVNENNFLITKDYNKWLDKNGQLDFLVSYPDLSNKDIEKMRDLMTVGFYTSFRHIVFTVIQNYNPLETLRLIRGALNYFKFLIKRRRAYQ
jgi:radical SAM superfamily enzyme YgiQ (UPF0313 family)